jgi:hypothetical protein
MDFYANRARALDEVLSWEHLDFGLHKQLLIAEREKDLPGEMTADCRTGECALCGACAVPLGPGR